MAEVLNIEFDKKARRIVKRHKRLARGYEAVVEENGIVVRRPVRQLPRVSKTGIFMVMLTLFCFKAFLFQNLGPQTYEDRVAKLAGGTVIEKAGAFVMQPDPVTLWLVDQYRGLL